MTTGARDLDRYCERTHYEGWLAQTQQRPGALPALPHKEVGWMAQEQMAQPDGGEYAILISPAQEDRGVLYQQLTERIGALTARLAAVEQEGDALRERLRVAVALLEEATRPMIRVPRLWCQDVQRLLEKEKL